MLLPALAKAKGKAHGIKCVNNTKQLLLATKIYADENVDRLPPSHTPGAPVGQQVSWADIILPYVGDDTNLYRDPAVFKPGNERLWQNMQVRTHYMANIDLGARNLGTGDVGVARPSSTVYMSDGGVVAVDSPIGSVAVTPTSTYKPGCWILIRPAGSEAFGTASAVSPGPAPNNWPDWGAPHMRHDNRTSTGFVDGHVEIVDASSWYYSNTPWTDPALGGP